MSPGGRLGGRGPLCVRLTWVPSPGLGRSPRYLWFSRGVGLETRRSPIHSIPGMNVASLVCDLASLSVWWRHGEWAPFPGDLLASPPPPPSPPTLCKRRQKRQKIAATAPGVVWTRRLSTHDLMTREVQFGGYAARRPSHDPPTQKGRVCISGHAAKVYINCSGFESHVPRQKSIRGARTGLQVHHGRLVVHNSRTICAGCTTGVDTQPPHDGMAH